MFLLCIDFSFNMLTIKRIASYISCYIFCRNITFCNNLAEFNITFAFDVFFANDISAYRTAHGYTVSCGDFSHHIAADRNTMPGGNGAVNVTAYAYGLSSGTTARYIPPKHLNYKLNVQILRFRYIQR